MHTAADIETVLKGKIKCIVMEYLSAKKKGRSVASPFLLLVQGLGKKYGEGHSFLQTSTERSRFLRRWVERLVVIKLANGRLREIWRQ